MLRIKEENANERKSKQEKRGTIDYFLLSSLFSLSFHLSFTNTYALTHTSISILFSLYYYIPHLSISGKVSIHSVEVEILEHCKSVHRSRE